MLLLGSSLWPPLLPGVVCRDHQKASGWAEKAEVTCSAHHSQRSSQAKAAPGWARPRWEMLAGLGDPCWEQRAPPLRAAAETEASHMCKMHLVKINVGFVFSIKTETKTQELLLK